MNDKEFHERIKELYHPPRNQFSLIEVPKIRYLGIDGKGDPADSDFKEATVWIESIVHFLVPTAKKILGSSIPYPPLECLFWADHNHLSINKEHWNWRVMTVLGNWATEEIVKNAVNQAEETIQKKTPSLEISHLLEGNCVQYLHVGDYDEVPTICDSLYNDFLNKKGLDGNGSYHEIYLNNPKTTSPKNRKIIIRQPVKTR